MPPSVYQFRDDEDIDDEELHLRSVIVRSYRNDNISLPIHHTNLKDAETTALIDSGAQGRFVDESIV